jgi:RNA polymerase sigma-70 factor, ECF subfamily
VEFEALANRHKDAVYRHLLQVCRNREDAEDVLIDALLRAWQSLDQLEDARAFRSWLTQIARRVCWHLRGREALIPLLQLSALPDGGAGFASAEPPPDARLESKRMKALLANALDDLPDPYREVYQMRDIEELSGEEVARRLGISLASMKSRLHRARAVLRERLESQLEGDHRD